MAEISAGVVAGDERVRTIEVLEGLGSTSDLMMNTATIEALSAYGLVSSEKGVDDITREIRAVVDGDVDERFREDLARGILSHQFEDDGIVGPYYEAVQSLRDEDRAELLRLGLAKTDSADIGAELFLRELAELGDLAREDVREVFDTFAVPDPKEWFSPQFGMRSFLEAVRVSGMYRDTPPICPDTCPEFRALAAIGELAFWYSKEDLGAEFPADRRAHLWSKLTGELRADVAGVLQLVKSSEGIVDGSALRILDRIKKENPDDLTEVLCWSLQNRESLRSLPRGNWGSDRDEFAVAVLGELGDARTAGSLRRFVDDPQIGAAAVRAIRSIEARRLDRHADESNLGS
jgi:hypothetical protein